MKTERILELLECERQCILRNSLETCNRDCINCDLLQDSDALLDMYDEVMSIISAQRPRVMSLEASEQEWLEATLWFEVKGKKATPCMYTARGERMMFGRYEILMYFDMVGSSKWNGYMVKNYGRTWRCWTSKPTDEQRKAVSWE